MDPSTEKPFAADGTTRSEEATLRSEAPSVSASYAEKDEERWTYGAQIQADQAALEARGLPGTRDLSLIWNHLSVRGVGGADDVVFAPDLGAIAAPWLVAKANKRVEAYTARRRERDPHNKMVWRPEMGTPKKGEPGLRKGQRYLFHDFSGSLSPGETMLVVGRPGSGCTTFLKSLAGLTGSYAGVEGSVQYGALEAGSKEMKSMSGDVAFVAENDEHDPNLTVSRTMDFALRTQTPAEGARALDPETGKPITPEQWQHKTKLDVLRAFHIEHTLPTKVGDSYVRGVSGGERKRVSLAECLTTGAQITMWDGATRGLDASTALAFAKQCRTISDEARKINVVSCYQAGNGIYAQFDKVTVIADGQVIYYGPRAEARGYFEALGFVHMDGANTADYLTAVTAVDERQIAEGFENVPTSAAEFAAIYAQSDVARRMRAQVDGMLADRAARESETEQERAYYASHRSKYAMSRFSQKVSFGSQMKAAIVKDVQQRWGDQWSFWARQLTTIVMGLVNGSIFYMIPATTTGLFLRCGVIFMMVLFPTILAFADVQASFEGRGVLGKHKAWSLYRPSAVLLAQTIVDLPILGAQIMLYVVSTYWMAGLQNLAGNFFMCWLFVVVCTLSLTTLFRTIGYSFNVYNDASKVSGSVFTFFVFYGGFSIYTPSMHPWLSWIRWINPIYYSMEAIIANELDNLHVTCAAPQLVPYGTPYAAAGMPSACAISGAVAGQDYVSGTAWMEAALWFYKRHVWRNFGIMIALWFIFIVLGMSMLEWLPAQGSTQDVTLFAREGSKVFTRDEEDDEVPGPAAFPDGHSIRRKPTRQDLERQLTAQSIHRVGTTFTWKNLTYTVQADGKDKQLLDKVSGYCKAGTITALMGSSGAGKTTLMDVLAARKSEGVITGEVLLNGQPLPISFQRTTGYCEQLDVHLPQATVREALEFSALLRQPRAIPDDEKLEYVETIMDLLELRNIEDAIIGEPGAGLGIEQRKRLNIGVELVSKPSLLFLDEPTSGLDGQSSYMIVSFLRKLAATGQSILCTIHQPSAALFAGFDQLLLLKAGGRTVYFGPTADMPEYFQSQGITWPEDVNPAEYMIDVVSGDLGKGRDFAQVWLDSPQYTKMIQELEEIKADSAQHAVHATEDGFEFAASTSTQMRLVTIRGSRQLYRNLEYVMNKCILHIVTGLVVGFSYWKIGNSYADLQNRLFAIFAFVLVAPGVIVQTQPKFIANRDMFETREKKAKFYSWKVFCFGEIVAEVPYLLICAFLFWACWYNTVGLDMSPGIAGPVFLQMIFYEFLYTGIGQSIAAYAPNATFAALVLPIVMSGLLSFCGVMIPYGAITVFWRYWLYYLDPFTYLIQGLVVFPMWDQEVVCKASEMGSFDPPSNMTCGEYLTTFMTYATGYVDNPDATSGCQYCGYAKGSEYLATMNMTRHIDGWKGILITLLFCCSSYALVFLLLKLRSKKTKTAA